MEAIGNLDFLSTGLRFGGTRGRLIQASRHGQSLDCVWVSRNETAFHNLFGSKDLITCIAWHLTWQSRHWEADADRITAIALRFSTIGPEFSAIDLAFFHIILKVMKTP